MGKENLTAAALSEQLKTITGEDALKTFAGKVISALADAEKQLDTAATMIIEHEEKAAAERKTNPNYRPEVVINKKTYRINHKVRSASGQVLELDEIAANAKLIQDLVKNQSSAVTELTKD
ncbi:hypothetical protein [Pedobacter sp.]|uniref:hypothetical protein n=1 Tax=Pedobacter sp. TaxID=1411316 RepID=UPI0031D0D4B3